MGPVSDAPAGVAFGRFQVLPHRRELLADGQPIKLGGRAFDVLMALIAARGEVVGKDALMARVWVDRVVETHNLEAQISTLRAVFGADRDLIRTVSGRGYQFTGELREPSWSPDEGTGTGSAAAQPAAGLPPTNLPAPVSELIGRDAEVAEVVSFIAAHRLVSLTGAGGIGKTQLALAAARQILPHFAGGVWLAEFSPLADPGLVPATVAAAVGLELGGGEVSAQRVAQALADRPLLLVLDTTISGSSDVEVAAHHLIHHLPHGCGTLRAEPALEFSLGTIPTGSSHCDALKTLVGDRHDSDAPIRFADCDSDQLVTLQRPKIVSDGRAIHGHELGEFTSP
jgi:DNA-binding winged helix-turn-helix (wHTH) protein